MSVNLQTLTRVIRERCTGIDRDYAEVYAQQLLEGLDERLLPNLEEWVEGRPVSNLWVGKYCVNAIMKIQGSSDFLSALDAMNAYLRDERKGKFLIWRGKR